MNIFLIEPSIYMTDYYRSIIYAPGALVRHMADGLVNRGHTVMLAAAANVNTKARILPGDRSYIELLDNVINRTELSFGEKEKQAFMIKRDFEADLWTRSFQQATREHFDIVHVYHVALGHYFEIFLSNTPVIYTLHDPLPVPDTLGHLVFTKFSNHRYVSISNAQRYSQTLKLNFVDTVYHGVALSEFPFIERSSDSLLFMGRLTPEKGLYDAIAASLALNMKLEIGTQFPNDHEVNPYYEDRIKPFLTHPLICKPGLVGEHEKSILYGHSKALLFPIHWEEPFGMVMIEAMACGTPVIAYNRGSVPEIVKDGVTGFIVDPPWEDTTGPRMQSSERSDSGQVATSVSRDLLQFDIPSISTGQLKYYGVYPEFSRGKRRTHRGMPSLTTPVASQHPWIIKKRGVEGLVEAVKRIGEIDRAACRRHVEEHFTVEKMVESYEKVYKKILII